MNEHMHLIGVKSHLHDFPLIDLDTLMNKLLEAFGSSPLQHLPTPFRTPDDVGDHQMDRVLLMPLVYVDTYTRYNVHCQHLRPPLASNKERFSSSA